MTIQQIVRKQFPKAIVLRIGTMGDFDLDLKDGTEPNSWMIKDGKAVPADFMYLATQTFGDISDLLKK